jgi:hypothetical protein
VPDDLPDTEILKKIAGAVLGHDFHTSSVMALAGGPLAPFLTGRTDWGKHFT